MFLIEMVHVYVVASVRYQLHLAPIQMEKNHENPTEEVRNVLPEIILWLHALPILFRIQA